MNTQNLITAMRLIAEAVVKEANNPDSCANYTFYAEEEAKKLLEQETEEKE